MWFNAALNFVVAPLRLALGILERFGLDPGRSIDQPAFWLPNPVSH